MKYNELIRKIKHLDMKYDCLDNEIYLLIETDNGDTIVGKLTDVDVWEDDKGGYGLDFCSEVQP